MTKPALDGIKAKFIFGELDELAEMTAMELIDAILAAFQEDQEATLKALQVAMESNTKAKKLILLLQAGKADEAESLILRGYKK